MMCGGALVYFILFMHQPKIAPLRAIFVLDTGLTGYAICGIGTYAS
jgi:hypothetical protein